MGKKKGRMEGSKTLISERRKIDYQIPREEADDEEAEAAAAKEAENVGGEEKFFACYLLTSLNPRHKGHTYIGFTVNPRRRIKQHNGEMRCGAWKTKRRRPWEMVLCIYGFPTNVAALQFEWAWQHPIESLAVRAEAAMFKSLSGVANKIKLAYTMLTLSPWNSLNLTVNFFSTKYTKHSAGCPSLQEQMKFQVCSMDELPCYIESEYNAFENDDEECDQAGGTQGSIKKGLADATVHNSPVHQNSSKETSFEQIRWIEEIGLRDPMDSPIRREDNRQPFSVNDSPVGAVSSFFTSSYSRGETVEDGDMSGLTEKVSVESELPTIMASDKIDLRELTFSPVRREDNRHPFYVDDSPMRATSSFYTSSCGREETLEDRDIFGLTEMSSVESDLPTTLASYKDYEPLIESPIVPNEVEVIDVFTPSPCFRISSCSKKRRPSAGCPEIIDLTKSPIFV